jgi:hypothetical protein
MDPFNLSIKANLSWQEVIVLIFLMVFIGYLKWLKRR